MCTKDFRWQLDELTEEFDQLASEATERLHWNWTCEWLNRLLGTLLAQEEYRRNITVEGPNTLFRERDFAPSIRLLSALRDKVIPYAEEEIASMREIAESNIQLLDL